MKLDESQHALSQPEPRKALIYFIQEKGSDAFAVTTGIGLDRAWVGANKNSSSFAASAEPGERGRALLPVQRAQLASLPASPQRLREATESRPHDPSASLRADS